MMCCLRPNVIWPAFNWFMISQWLKRTHLKSTSSCSCHHINAGRTTIFCPFFLPSRTRYVHPARDMKRSCTFFFFLPFSPSKVSISPFIPAWVFGPECACVCLKPVARMRRTLSTIDAEERKWMNHARNKKPLIGRIFGQDKHEAGTPSGIHRNLG